jgi:hypothetical protein
MEELPKNPNSVLPDEDQTKLPLCIDRNHVENK